MVVKEYNRYRCTKCNCTVDSLKEMEEILIKNNIPCPGPCPNCGMKVSSGRIEELNFTTLILEKIVKKTDKQHKYGGREDIVNE